MNNNDNKKIYICETCGKEFTEDYRKSKSSRRTPMRFCSRSCACKHNGKLNPNKFQKGHPDYLKGYYDSAGKFITREYNKLRDDLFCKYCGKQCKSLNSLKNHEIRCKFNEGRSLKISAEGLIKFNKDCQLGKAKRSNQYIKARLENREYCIKESTRQKMSKSRKRIEESKSPEERKKIREKISRAIRTKVEEGSWHNSISKKLQYLYKNEVYDSSWEILFVKFLERKGYNWKRNEEIFPYFFEKDRLYRPDFYIEDTQTYVEIKGFARKKDLAKWSQFPKNKNLKIIYQKDLEKITEMKLNKKIDPSELYDDVSKVSKCRDFEILRSSNLD